MKTFACLIFCGLFMNSAIGQEAEWAYQIGGLSSEGYLKMEVDQDSNLILTGVFLGTVDFDPGPDSMMLTAASKDLYIAKMSPIGELIWVKQIENVDDQVGIKLTVSNAGNITIVGKFNGVVDFDPGTGSHVLSSGAIGGEKRMFALRLSASGDFVWAKVVGEFYCFNSGSIQGSIQPNDVATDMQESVYIVGSYDCETDLDPGPGVANLPAPISNSPDIFVVKLDSLGDFQWAGGAGNSSIDEAGDVFVDSVGTVFVSGRFQHTVDFDFGLGVHNRTATGQINHFLLLLDSSGNFIRVTAGSGLTNNSSVHNRTFNTIDENGNTYVCGEFRGTMDFDSGPGVSTLTSNSSSNTHIFVLKQDSLGNFVWAKNFGGPSLNYPYDIEVDRHGAVYVVGSFNLSIDLNPDTTAISEHFALGLSDAFILKLDSLGNYVWGQTFGTPQHESIHSIELMNLGNLYLAGSFWNSVDFDPGPDSITLQSFGSSDVFISKWKQDACSQFVVLVDSVKDVRCQDLGYASGFAYGGGAPYSYSWSTTPSTADSMALLDFGGVYTLSVTDNSGCLRETSVLIEAPTGLNNYDFSVNLATANFRPGFNTTLNISALNQGCHDSTGQIGIIIDSLYLVDSSSITPDYVMGDTLIWNHQSLIFDSTNFSFSLYGQTSLAANIGDQACFEVFITPLVGDIDTTNNRKSYCFDIINSYDPNDKQVYPIGECEEGLVDSNQTLTYTVRFQNTGNADAVNIFIMDSLDSDLNLNSVKIVGQSHEPMITEVLPDNTLKFRFDNIHLPDSTTHEPESHGYVIFEVNPLPGVSAGTQIENRADIYFDFNDPILTNVVSNVVVDTLPEWEVTISQSGSILTTINLPHATYQWMDCETGLYIQNAIQRSFFAESHGVYAVVVSNDGCTKMSDCYDVLSVGIEEGVLPDLAYYPNPTDGLVIIDFGQRYQAIQVEVIDITGQILGEIRAVQVAQLEVVLPELKGVYLLRIVADENQVLKKVVRD